jgi:hypothetical protein
LFLLFFVITEVFILVAIHRHVEVVTRHPDGLKLNGSLHGDVIDFNVLHESEAVFTRSILEAATLKLPKPLTVLKNELDVRQQ